MHEIKEYIRKIVDDGNIEKMYKLSDMLDELAHTVKQFDKDLYKKYKMELYRNGLWRCVDGENGSRNYF